MVLLSLNSPHCIHVLSWGDQILAKHSRYVSPLLSRRQGSPSIYWQCSALPAAQDAVSCLCSMGALPAHGQLAVHLQSKVFLRRPALQMVGTEYILVPGVTPPWLQDLALPLCWTSWYSCQSVSSTYWGPSGWWHDSLVCQPLLSVLYHFVEVFAHIFCTLSLHPGHQWCYETGPCISPCGAQLVAGLYLDFVLLITNNPLDHLSLPSFRVLFLLKYDFNQELLLHPCRPPVTTAWLPAHGNGEFLNLEEVILKYQLSFLDPSLWGCTPWGSFKLIREKSKICSHGAEDHKIVEWKYGLGWKAP